MRFVYIYFQRNFDSQNMVNIILQPLRKILDIIRNVFIAIIQ